MVFKRNKDNSKKTSDSGTNNNAQSKTEQVKIDEVIVTRDNYKQRLLEMDELRLKQVRLIEDNDVRKTKSVIQLIDTISGEPRISNSYDGRQGDIDQVSEQILLYEKGFDAFLTEIMRDKEQKQKKITDLQSNIEETIRKIEDYRQQKDRFETCIKSINTELKKCESIEKEIRQDLSSQTYSQKKLDMDKHLIIQVGDVIQFGVYPQDESGTETDPIEWVVIEIKDDKALLLCKYAIDCQKFNNEAKSATWERCSLRKWLNNTFFKNAFSVKERSRVQMTLVNSDNNQNYKTAAGNSTRDKVFLLSIKEVKQYLKKTEYRKCKETDYCYEMGAYKKDDNCYWLLRTPGYDSSYIAFVDSDGYINYNGISVNHNRYAIRPALCIEI